MNAWLPFRPELAKTLKDHSWHFDLGNRTDVNDGTLSRAKKLTGLAGGFPARSEIRLGSD